MEGKRFGVGLAVGLLLGVALVGVSGGLGFTPIAQFSVNRGAASTTEVTSTSSQTLSSATLSTVTYTASTTTTTGGSSNPSQWTSATNAYPSTSTATLGTTSTTTLSITSSSAGTTPASPADQGSAANGNGGTTGGLSNPGLNFGPSHLANIPQQPIMSNAEILVPVLVAFLLGAFLYRVTMKEREGSGVEA